MTAQEAIKRLKDWQQCEDKEVAGSGADCIIAEFLIDLGYEDVVEEWCNVERWYA